MPRPEKKKLGNNLNKLLVQPNAAAPPIKDSKAAAARQGLLLLSARKSNGLLGGPSNNHNAATTTSALKTTTTTVLDPKVSQHDVLLSAVNKGKQAAEKAPDAWGTVQGPTAVTTVPSGGGGTNEPDRSSPRAEPVDTMGRWDDYNRGRQDSVTVSENNGSNNQETYMSRLAKERAEKRQAEEQDRVREQQERAAARLRGLEEQKGSSSWDQSRSAGRLWEPDDANNKKQPDNNNTAASSPPETDPYSRGPSVVHHLSSYEDRDRGERQAGPRMLFDPKSGSMVAVKARDENHARGGGRKERGDVHPRGGRKNNPRKTQDSPMILENGRRKLKAGLEQQQMRKSDRKGVANPSRRLPRTRGVLYARDEKGVIYCADGCEGDLGYGAHSVPGGRANNPEAYAVFLKEQEKHLKDGTEPQVPSYYDADKYKMDAETNVTLQTGFHPEEEPVLGPLEWIKADDKMELVTGADDSPMLKPTAKEWAPSQAALAAAAAVAKEQGLLDHQASVDDDGGESEDDEGDGSEFGLGFDPTQDMDGLLSPTTSTSKHLDGLAGVDLKALTLEPSMFPTAAAAAEDKRPAHTQIFSFGTSGTWGVSSSANENTGNDWGVLFGGDAFRKPSDPTSFLNLPSGNSWGSSSLGGIPLNGGDTAKTAGD